MGLSAMRNLPFTYLVGVGASSMEKARKFCFLPKHPDQLSNSTHLAREALQHWSMGPTTTHELDDGPMHKIKWRFEDVRADGELAWCEFDEPTTKLLEDMHMLKENNATGEPRACTLLRSRDVVFYDSGIVSVHAHTPCQCPLNSRD